MSYPRSQRTAWIAIILGLAILTHQFLTWGRIDLADILHHEWFSATLIAFGIGILWILPKRYRRPPT